ncbi:hypothetical protein [Microbulbifer spongiae]|uniref:Uncharacterized protein n=1 Tax=Microbulbifer spongiae TaxID=2944933 RepID=A0ABY9EIW5_9GAMM|nr:hypothetical protein [Microbulbifer sp. MI-G]WKD51695.1 hypothetical protein M8T91_18745 [Microbulbifer sp. MI-G]
MFKRLSLTLALATVFTSANSFAADCATTWKRVPIAWETIYSYRNECAYFIKTSYTNYDGETIEVEGAASYDTSWSTNLDNVRCPASSIGQITYANISKPEKTIDPEFGHIPLFSAELIVREERGEPTEWDLVNVTTPPGCIPR